MDFYINLRVNFRGNSKNFLLSGSETKSWESMEAMVRGPLSNCSGHTIAHRFTRMTQVCFVFGRRKAEVRLLNAFDAFVTAWLQHIYNLPVEHLGGWNVRMAHTPRQVDRTVSEWTGGLSIVRMGLVSLCVVMETMFTSSILLVGGVWVTYPPFDVRVAQVCYQHVIISLLVS